ncbi:MAG: SDR family oxidoreductase [Patulibacter sp.]|nr:SDR family oxidoreductase [Patulibacter sp.]
MGATGRTWFITGASRGFGREWTVAALERGDRVVATARDPRTLADLEERFGERVLALRLDVTDRAGVFATVARAHEHFGGLDIVVNNAGYGLFGMVEEVAEQEARDQFETNVFGALWVTQAALPFLREQGRGHLVQVSSVGGLLSIPSLGIYHASKYALEGFSQSLAAEVAPFGIHVTLVEPGAFATDWGGASAHGAAPLDAYAPAHAVMNQARASNSHGRGNPAATAEAVLRIVDAEQPPLRCFLGSGNLALIEGEYDARLATWRAWQDTAELAQG